MKEALNIKKILITLFIFAFGLLFLSPFFWMLSASFKPEAEVFRYPVQWIPETWHAVENYKKVWFGTHPPFYHYYWNSIKVVILTTMTSIIVSSLAAYSFAKLNFKGKDILFLIVLATFMVPSQSLFVPQFILFRWMNLYDTHLALILLHSFSVLGTFMLRQFFLGILNDYLDSGKMDGAGHLRIFTHIALPMVLPAIATYGILRFIWTWNDYQMPLIFLHSIDLYTLQLGIRQFADENGQIYSLQMAAAVLAVVPLLIVFLIAQKQVIEGIQLGGVKG